MIRLKTQGTSALLIWLAQAKVKLVKKLVTIATATNTLNSCPHFTAD